MLDFGSWAAEPRYRSADESPAILVGVTVRFGVSAVQFITDTSAVAAMPFVVALEESRSTESEDHADLTRYLRTMTQRFDARGLNFSVARAPEGAEPELPVQFE